MNKKEMKEAVLKGGAWLVICVAALGLGFLGKMGWEQWMQKQMAAMVLAKDEVAFLMEASWDEAERQEWNELFARWSMWQVENLEKGVSEWLGLSENLKGLSRVAVAVTPEKEVVLLVEDFPEEVLTKMEEEWEGKWNEDVVNAQTRAVSWTERKGFTIFGRSEEIVRKVLEGKKLGETADFARVRDALPHGVALAFFDGEKLIQDDEDQIDLWRPVAELVQRGGLSLEVEDGGILIRSKTMFGGLTDSLGKIFSRVKSMRRGDLAGWFPKETWLFWESADLPSEWEDWENVLGGSAPVLNELVKGRVEYWEEGTGLSLKEDVLQLADGPFAIGLLPEGGWVFVAENDEEWLQDKMAFFEDLLTSRVPAMFPEMTGVQGALGKTVQAVKMGRAPLKEEFEMDGMKVIVLDFDDGVPWDLAWTIVDGKLILANSKQVMTDLLVARNQDEGMLDEKENFVQGEKWLSGMKSDLMFGEMETLTDWLSEKWQTVLAPFESLAEGKNLLDLESVATWWLKVRR